MPTYLLLRNNKQSGPHSYEEMLKMGFCKYDLVWVEGKSAAWRYPGEISEFSEFAPLVEEQPYDRFFKRKAAVVGTTGPPAEAVMPSTTAAQEPMPQEPLPSRKSLSDLLKARRVAVTMPAGKSSSPIITPVKKHAEQVKEPANIVVTAKGHAEVVKEPASINVTAKTQAEQVKEPANKVPQPKVESKPTTIPDPDAPYLPKDLQFTPKEKPTVNAMVAQAARQEEDVQDLYPSYVPSKPFSGDYSQYLQYIGVATALISLLVVGILIGKGMAVETTPPAVLVSEQPSRIAELKKKLMTESAEVPASDGEDFENSENIPDPQVRDLAIKERVEPAKKELSVNTSYKTSGAPSPVTAEGKERESSKTEPSSSEMISSTDLASKMAISLNGYKVNMFGGIDGIEVTLKNNAPVPVEEAVVELQYILSNKNKGHLTETLVFRNLNPGQSKTLPGPKSSRGIRLEYRLVSAR